MTEVNKSVSGSTPSGERSTDNQLRVFLVLLAAVVQMRLGFYNATAAYVHRSDLNLKKKPTAGQMICFLFLPTHAGLEYVNGHVVFGYGRLFPIGSINLDRVCINAKTGERGRGANLASMLV